MAEEDAADRASQEIKALLRRLDPKGELTKLGVVAVVAMTFHRCCHC
jgi:hypothetical protein